ncbi:hypothetical protein ACIRNI_28650 [Streptomyces sp. NPDC093546]|uniref:hypothetical protein n=1 Tax=Streptomyces sp. NPDC093546 TaxID=3366040 RepID=UPI00381E5814
MTSSVLISICTSYGNEVHHQVRPYGSGAEPLTEKDGTALANGLLSAMAKTAARAAGQPKGRFQRPPHGRGRPLWIVGRVSGGRILVCGRRSTSG